MKPLNIEDSERVVFAAANAKLKWAWNDEKSGKRNTHTVYYDSDFVTYNNTTFKFQIGVLNNQIVSVKVIVDDNGLGCTEYIIDNSLMLRKDISKLLNNLLKRIQYPNYIKDILEYASTVTPKRNFEQTKLFKEE